MHIFKIIAFCLVSMCYNGAKVRTEITQAIDKYKGEYPQGGIWRMLKMSHLVANSHKEQNSGTKKPAISWFLSVTD